MQHGINRQGCMGPDITEGAFKQHSRCWLELVCWSSLQLKQQNPTSWPQQCWMLDSEKVQRTTAGALAASKTNQANPKAPKRPD